jgi:hypothetical protein
MSQEDFVPSSQPELDGKIAARLHGEIPEFDPAVIEYTNEKLKNHECCRAPEFSPEYLASVKEEKQESMHLVWEESQPPPAKIESLPPTTTEVKKEEDSGPSQTDSQYSPRKRKEDSPPLPPTIPEEKKEEKKVEPSQVTQSVDVELSQPPPPPPEKEEKKEGKLKDRDVIVISDDEDDDDLPPTQKDEFQTPPSQSLSPGSNGTQDDIAPSPKRQRMQADVSEQETQDYSSE